MMDRIIGVWTGNHAPEPLERASFLNDESYELYLMVCHAYRVRKEVNAYKQYLKEHGLNTRISEAIIYESATLAKLEYQIEAMLIKLRK